MKDVTNIIDIKKCLELIQYIDYYNIRSLGQLIEVLVYTPKKYKTFEFCYDNVKDVTFDEPDIQGEKLKFWFNLLVNKEGFAELVNSYFSYKAETENY